MLDQFLGAGRDRTPDILECLANLSNDEVFTPPAVANAMLDMLPVEVWSDPSLRWLDPGTKSGVFLREIARRLMVGLADQIPDVELRRAHILRDMLFGIALTDLTAQISRRTLYYSKSANSPVVGGHFTDPAGNIVLPKADHNWVGTSCSICGAPKSAFDRSGKENHAYAFIHLTEVFPDMQFDVIIGNPPYHIDDGGHGASAKHIFHHFIRRAKELNPKHLSMIVPARWYAGGKGLDEFRAEMIADRQISHLVDYPKLYDAFPGVKIRGGVCYFLRSVDHDDDCKVRTVIDGEIVSTATRDLRAAGDVLIRDNRAVPILAKVQTAGYETLGEQVSARKPFDMPTNFSEYSKTKKAGHLKLHGNKFVGWVDKKHVTKNNDWISKHKTLVPKAGGGEGTVPDMGIAKPITIGPNEVCTETYLVVGVFDTAAEAEALAEYLRTRFARFMVSLRKPTQNGSANSFGFVPKVPLNKTWTDAELFKLFNLTVDEIAVIEEQITERP